MKALMAFIGMAVVILALIEVNERIKAKRKKEDCPKDSPDNQACTDCSLLEICEKSSKSTAEP